MAHYPRWIRSERVDSPAMLSAFLAWRKEDTKDPDGTQPHGDLFMVEHAIRSTFLVGGRVVQPQHVPAPVPTVPCVAGGCTRCLTLRGGYQFKWHSHLWGHEYQRKCRAGSWVPGEPEA